MIYGQHFNIVHMPKTGGTWLRRVCEKLPKSIIREIYPHHRPAKDLTEAEAKLPTYIFVRNPWDWYVSLYGHKHGNIVHKRHEFRPPFHKLDAHQKHAYQRFRGSFEESLAFLSEHSEGPPHSIHPLFNWMGQTFENFRQPRVDAPDPIVLRFEDGVKDGLIRIIDETSPELLTPHVMREIDTTGAKNVSERKRDYREYYTPQWRDRVAREDASLIREHGYVFHPDKGPLPLAPRASASLRESSSASAPSARFLGVSPGGTVQGKKLPLWSGR